jgi:hypothetical protein
MSLTNSEKHCSPNGLGAVAARLFAPDISALLAPARNGRREERAALRL